MIKGDYDIHNYLENKNKYFEEIRKDYLKKEKNLKYFLEHDVKPYTLSGYTIFATGYGMGGSLAITACAHKFVSKCVINNPNLKGVSLLPILNFDNQHNFFTNDGNYKVLLYFTEKILKNENYDLSNALFEVSTYDQPAYLKLKGHNIYSSFNLLA